MGLNQASILLNLAKDAPEDIDQILREELDTGGRTIRIREIASGPPTAGVEISITGSDYDDIVAVSQKLTASISELDEVINIESNVAQARDEASHSGRPREGGEYRPEHEAGRPAVEPVPHRRDRHADYHRRYGHRRGAVRQPEGGQRDRGG